MRLIQLFLLALTALFSLAAFSSAQAEVMNMKSIGETPANAPSGVVRPQRASTMDQVKLQFGEPMDTKAAVGEPPITRWEYTNFTVYFEYNRVIDAVVHPAAMAQ